MGLSCLTAVFSPSGLGVSGRRGRRPRLRVIRGLARRLGGRVQLLRGDTEEEGGAAFAAPGPSRGDRKRRPVGVGLPVGGLAAPPSDPAQRAANQAQNNLKRTYKD